MRIKERRGWNNRNESWKAKPNKTKPLSLSISLSSLSLSSLSSLSVKWSKWEEKCRGKAQRVWQSVKPHHPPKTKTRRNPLLVPPEPVFRFFFFLSLFPFYFIFFCSLFIKTSQVENFFTFFFEIHLFSAFTLCHIPKTFIFLFFFPLFIYWVLPFVTEF